MLSAGCCSKFLQYWRTKNSPRCVLYAVSAADAVGQLECNVSFVTEAVKPTSKQISEGTHNFAGDCLFPDKQCRNWSGTSWNKWYSAVRRTCVQNLYKVWHRTNLGMENVGWWCWYQHHLHSSLTACSLQLCTVLKTDSAPLLQILPGIFLMENAGFNCDTVTTACSKTTKYALGQSNLYRMFLTKY
jgi:hypothetical protein